MRKVFGILAIVLGIWIGIEVYTQGADRAFGGLFAWFQKTDPEDVREQSVTPVTRRAEKAFQRAYDKSLDRVDEQLEREGH